MQVLHVSRTGLPVPTDDRQIWEWTKANNRLVISNDEDFCRFAGVLGLPPKVVMLRSASQSSRFVAALLTSIRQIYRQLADSSKKPGSGILSAYVSLPTANHANQVRQHAELAAGKLY